jgi:hypothetical protein
VNRYDKRLEVSEGDLTPNYTNEFLEGQSAGDSPNPTGDQRRRVALQEKAPRMEGSSDLISRLLLDSIVIATQI